MTASARPEYAEVALWDDLTRLGAKYLKAARLAKSRGVHQADVNYLARCAVQCAATIQRMSEGSITFAQGLDLFDTLDKHLADAAHLAHERAAS